MRGSSKSEEILSAVRAVLSEPDEFINQHHAPPKIAAELLKWTEQAVADIEGGKKFTVLPPVVCCPFCAFTGDLEAIRDHIDMYVVPRTEEEISDPSENLRAESFVMTVDELNKLIREAGFTWVRETRFWTVWSKETGPHPSVPGSTKTILWIEAPRLRHQRDHLVHSHVVNWVTGQIAKAAELEVRVPEDTAPAPQPEKIGSTVPRKRRVRYRGASKRVLQALMDAGEVASTAQHVHRETSLPVVVVVRACQYLVDEYPSLVGTDTKGLFWYHGPKSLGDAQAALKMTQAATGAVFAFEDGDDDLDMPTIPQARTQPPGGVSDDAWVLLSMVLPDGVPGGIDWDDLKFIMEWVDLTREVIRRYR